MAKKNPHIGSSFDDFLEDEGFLAETEAEAIKRVLAWQLTEFMAIHNKKKVEMAREMHTSRSQLDRLLDPANISVSLKTMAAAANVMGKKLEIKLA
ncbi:MAG: Fis family transcriptional regulator [Cellvibrionaceae bacterium]|jgi:antitoxin HicB|nr:Fis family transcriptional regulator [Cellvibrionaceae bacterium]|tara:strand:+ start:2122 stop:2409 length:288 start_codon:yes stop_codon:yes gene_type:complete